MMHQQGMNPAAFAEIELIPETHHEPYFSINCENTTGEFSRPLMEQTEAALQRLKIKLSDKRVKSSFKRSFIFPFIKIVRRNNSSVIVCVAPPVVIGRTQRHGENQGSVSLCFYWIG